MTAKALESFGGKLAEQWVATLLTPVFIFWLGSFVTAIQRLGWNTLVIRYVAYPEPLQLAISRCSVYSCRLCLRHTTFRYPNYSIFRRLLVPVASTCSASLHCLLSSVQTSPHQTKQHPENPRKGKQG